ncbi:hypothetical protein P7K49_034867 [Saguinus oedipus]|uniref:Uncharacterized protein n=1 Tax=Saguinus oedipus TaxID=9490 RepID=A0ABQ9TWV7_SAGOE|nr:hypothetical protein P7K49_034867 [Saguinus oedipus]
MMAGTKQMGTFAETLILLSALYLWVQTPRLRGGGHLLGSFLLGAVLTTETLQKYLEVVMALEYDEKPPYAMLRNSLEALLQDLRVSPYDPIGLPMVS